MLDSFGRDIRYLRLSVTEACNLACRYCVPEGGSCRHTGGEMSPDELLRAVRVASSCGIDKVRVTGGEPLTRPDIVPLCRAIADTPGIREVCLTTNGLALPSLSRPLVQAGVNRVNISLDTLDEKKYAYITRGGCLSQALRGIDAALDAGFQKVKLNCVLIGSFNDDEIAPLIALTRERPVDVRFIELMPMVSPLPGDFLSLDAVLPFLAGAESLPSRGVAQEYRLKGHRGNVGLIRPVTCAFCTSCDRLRLSADGMIRPCLASPLEYSVRGLDEEGMRQQFLRAISSKPASHGGFSPDHPSRAGRTMDRIGG